MNILLCLGLGYSSAVLARRLAASGWRIIGTSRTEASAARLDAEGWTGIVFDGGAPSAVLASAIGTATHIINSIPPEDGGDPALQHHDADLRGSPSLRWIGYFSTVGVYGDSAGRWVDEDTPCLPASARGRRRLDTERAWQALGAATGKPVAVFRLPGIYGPGRSAFDQLRAGTARRIIKPGQVFNRCHVDDIASAVAAAIAAPDAGGVFNVTDDAPCPADEVVTHAAHLLGIEPPPAVAFADAGLSPMALSFYGESKRVSNARLKARLGWTPAYPSYREGLAAILAAGG